MNAAHASRATTTTARPAGAPAAAAARGARGGGGRTGGGAPPGRTGRPYSSKALGSPTGGAAVDDRRRAGCRARGCGARGAAAAAPTGARRGVTAAGRRVACRRRRRRRRPRSARGGSLGDRPGVVVVHGWSRALCRVRGPLQCAKGVWDPDVRRIARDPGAPGSDGPAPAPILTAMGPQRGSAVLERRETETPIRVDTRTPGDARRDRRRAVTLLGLTVVVPGTAQLAAGNRRLGRFALRVWLGLLVAAALVGLLAPGQAAPPPSPWSPTAGRSLARCRSCSSAFAALWAVLLVDAWRLGQPDRLPRRDRRGLLVVLLALLLVLPGGAAYAGMNVGAARAAMTLGVRQRRGGRRGRRPLQHPAARRRQRRGPRPGCGPTASSSPASTPRPAARCSSASPARPRTSRSAPARSWPA